MARSSIEVPWDVTFPQVCARCMAPAEKVKIVKRQKPSTQRWFFFFGLIGYWIAGEGKKNNITFEVPYCKDCYRRERILPWAIFGAFLLAVLILCGFSGLAAQLEKSSDLASQVGAVVTIALPIVMIVTGLALVIVLSNHQALHIRFIREQTESAMLAFKNPAYFERFYQDNLEKIVSFALRYGKKMPVPLDQAITTVSRRIDEQNLHSPESLSGLFERAQLYLQAGDNERALLDLNHVIEVTGFENPYFLEAKFFRGQALMQTGRNNQAQADLESYVQASSNRSRVGQAKKWLKQISRA